MDIYFSYLLGYIFGSKSQRDEKAPEAHHFLRNLLEKGGKEMNTFRKSKYQAPSGNGDARA